MSKLRRLVILVIFGLSALIMLENARSIEQTHSVQAVDATAPFATADLFE